MKIALLGATRGTGRQVLELLLQRGHSVSALARDTTALPRHDQLTPVQGDARNSADVEKVLAGADAVVSCLGTQNLKVADKLVSTCLAATLAAMKRQGVRRIVFLSAEGMGDSANAPLRVLGAAMRFFAPAAHDTVIADKERSEELLRASGLDWTSVRPPMLTDGSGTAYRAFAGPSLSPNVRVSRRAVAHFIADELEAGSWVGRAATVRAG